MICDGDVVADTDVADETASPGLREGGQGSGVCARPIYRHVRVACFIASAEMSVRCNNCVRGGTIRRAARIKISVPSFA
jgi:hypothetical protein